MRNISAWAIRNPIPPIVLFLALTLAGLISFARMDINNMPDISFPGAQVEIVQIDRGHAISAGALFDEIKFHS